MVGTECHQAAKGNRQRGRSRPQLNLMPGLRSPVTSSASRETEAQKEGTCLFEDESRAEGLGQAMESLSLVSEDKQVVISVLPGLGTAKD